VEVGTPVEGHLGVTRPVIDAVPLVADPAGREEAGPLAAIDADLNDE
jgi:hypothetical protein